MGNIKVDPNELRQSAQRISSNKSQMSSILSRLDGKINRADSYWMGMSQRSFNCDYADARKSITAMISEIGKIADKLRSAAGEYEEKDNSIKDKIEDALSFINDTADSDKLLMLNSKLKFKVFKKNGKLCIKLINGKAVDAKTFAEYKKLLQKELGIKKLDNKTVKKLLEKGMILYNSEKGKYFGSSKKYIDAMNFKILNKYIGSIKEGKFKTFSSNFKESFISSFKYGEDFNWKGLSNISKLGKTAGIIGNVATVGGDLLSDFHDKNGNWNFSGNSIKNFAIDSGVDLGSGAGAAAVGAGVGSLIVPPLGTVVGAGVGIAANYLINNVKIGCLNNNSAVDYLKKTLGKG